MGYGGWEEMIGDTCLLSSKIELDREEGDVRWRGRDAAKRNTEKVMEGDGGD